MQRAITGFHQDDVGDWVAELVCGHGQHVRHQPPFVLRPWAATAEGRAGRLGAELACLRCTRFEIPEHFVPTRRTPEFSESTVPAGLLADHTTKAGTWARIVVAEGAVGYVVESLGHTQVLTPDVVGVVIPEVPHHLVPRGPVRFHVEFLRAPEVVG